MGDDQDAKDTQVLPSKNTAFEMDGTEEMDRGALLARLQPDQHSKSQTPTRDSEERDTVQHPAIVAQTRPTEPTMVPFEPTQHYQVPDSLIQQSRDDEADEELPTTTFSMEALLEFDAVVDAHGRIALPESALRGRFAQGARIHIVAHIIEDT